MLLSKIRKAARELLTLPENDHKRIFEGEALLRRLLELGVLKPEEKRLDYVLGLTIQQFLERRLQTLVAKSGTVATSVHMARVLVYSRHIKVGNQKVNVPSYLVKVKNENKISLSTNSSLSGFKPGRTKKNKAKKAKAATENKGEEEADK